MWDLPRPGLEPVSPALVGRLSTTAPPGKPSRVILKLFFWHCLESGAFEAEIMEAYGYCGGFWSQVKLWECLPVGGGEHSHWKREGQGDQGLGYRKDHLCGY